MLRMGESKRRAAGKNNSTMARFYSQGQSRRGVAPGSLTHLGQVVKVLSKKAKVLGASR